MSMSARRHVSDAKSTSKQYYDACAAYYRTIIPPHASVLYCGPAEEIIKAHLQPQRWLALQAHELVHASGNTILWDYIIVAPEYLGDEKDLYERVRAIRMHADMRTRLLIGRVAHWSALVSRMPCISHQLITAALTASSYEIVMSHHSLGKGKLSAPFFTMLFSLPIFRWVAPIQFYVVRSLVSQTEIERYHQSGPSVSFIIPCRNEAGTVAEILRRLPILGSFTEFLCVEGHSQDETLQELYRVQKMYMHERRIEVMVQTGRYKGNAVIEACARARGDIIIIFDGDMTVNPEDMILFYEALVLRRGDLINGTRFLFSMEKGAMRTLNWFVNKGFAWILSVMMRQKVTDTFCGTKACWRVDYERSRAVDAALWKRDPFGDFAWLLGANGWGGVICEVPVAYRNRTYGKPISGRFGYGIQLCVTLWHCLWSSERGQ